MDSDSDAYLKFKDHRKWFNKLWFSESMGYHCGPCGIAPPISGTYIVRPVINLSGMSVGAKRKFIDAGDTHKTPPGYFWCEFFEGSQHSITYEWFDDKWIPTSCWQGYKSNDNLTRFSKWVRKEPKDYHLTLPDFFSELHIAEKINVEFIKDKPIEVHLRASPDPDYDILIPIWADQKKLIDIYRKKNYNIISSYDDADGHLDVPRIAFAVKNRKD